MIRLSRSTDYALIALSDLAALPADETLSARRVAAGRGLPADLVAKILQGLRRAGLVSTRQGVLGGYRLARPPDEVPLIEVIEAVEGPLALVECCLDEHNCSLTPTCGVRAPLRRIHDLVAKTLSRLTLSHLLPGADFPDDSPDELPDDSREDSPDELPARRAPEAAAPAPPPPAPPSRAAFPRLPSASPSPPAAGAAG